MTQIFLSPNHPNMQEISSPKLYIMTQKRKSRPRDISGDVSTTTKPSKVAPLCNLFFALYSTVNIWSIWSNKCWIWSNKCRLCPRNRILDNKFVFSNPMDWEDFLDYMFSLLFSQHKVAKRWIFIIAFRKDKSNNKQVCGF